MRRWSIISWLFFGMLVACGGLAVWQLDVRVASLLANTAWLVAGVEVVALPLGVLLSVLIAKTDVFGRHAAVTLLVALMFVPLYVVAGAWDAGFGIQGWHTLLTNPHLAREPWLAGWRGAIWIHALAAVPWVALIVAAGLRTVEAELEEDALLEAPAWRVLCRVTLRRAAAAIVVAAVWVAMVASSEISVTDLFQVRTFAEEVYTEAALGAFDFSTASTDAPGEGSLSVRSLWIGVALAALLAFAALAAGRSFFDDLAHAPERRPWTWQLARGRWPAAIGLWFVLAIIAGAPLGNLIYKAGVHVESSEAGRVRQWSAMKSAERVAAAPREFSAELWQSAKIGAAAATAAVVVGVLLAWTMRDGRRFPGTQLGILAFLMAIPGPIIGIALIRTLNRPPHSALAGLAWLYDTNFAPWLAQTLRALPLVMLVLWPALASIPQSMLDAAKTEGAGWWRQLLRIALPQRLPALTVAWLVGLAVAVGELAATVLVVPPGSTTISVRIFSLIHYGVDDRVAAICLVLCGALAALVAIAAMFGRMKA